MKSTLYIFKMLVSFTSHNFLEIHPSCCIYQQFIPFYCQLVIHGIMDSFLLSTGNPLNMPTNLENSAVATGREKVSFHSSPKERQCQRMLKAKLSHFSCVRLCATPQMAAARLPRPWDSPGKNTGVGCYFLLQCMKVKIESEVVQSFPTLCDPMDCSLPGSSIHGILQARVLEWGAIAFSKHLTQS